MDEVPEHLRRYPSRAGREGLAARLGMTIDPRSQDWEWEVAAPEHFQRWLTMYQSAPLTDEERVSLMEVLMQCVEDMALTHGLAGRVEQMPQWQALATLLRANPGLHASTIHYWSVLGHDEPDKLFRVSVPMRRVWADIQGIIAAEGTRP